MFKALILSLFLTGSVPWEERTELFAGITCPSSSDAERIANTYQTYNLASNLSETRCLFVAFQGTKLGETDVFGIGNTLYRFEIVDYEGYTVYVLENLGEGYVA